MTKIEWTNNTWNPIVGCSLASPGCTNCYAMSMAARLETIAAADIRKNSDRANYEAPLAHYLGSTKIVNGLSVWTGKLTRAPAYVLRAPLRLRKATMYFVNSMSDLFHEDVPDAWIDQVFAIMALTPQHTYQLLTKRSGRMRDYFRRDGLGLSVALEIEGMSNNVPPEKRVIPTWPLPNVWLGVSCEDQKRADERIPDLLATPAAVRFVSAEPLLGAIDFGAVKYTHVPGFFGSALGWHHRGHCHEQEGLVYPTLDWVIVGGESGPRARSCFVDDVRAIVQQCKTHDVAVFVKQLGARAGLKSRKGSNMAEWPADLRVREWPKQIAIEDAA